MLPNELILIIFDYINEIANKRNFLMTCKTYNNLRKEVMKNVKYAVFKVKPCDHYHFFSLIGVCNSIELGYQCINEFAIKDKYGENGEYYESDESNESNESNEYNIIIGHRDVNYEYEYDTFIIEELLLDKLIFSKYW